MVHVHLDRLLRQVWVKTPEVLVLDVFENEGRRHVGRVSDLVDELDDVGVLLDSVQCQQFPPHLLLLHGLQHFDDDGLVREQVAGFEHFRIPAPPYLLNEFIVVLPVESHFRIFVVPIRFTFNLSMFFDGIGIAFRQKFIWYYDFNTFLQSHSLNNFIAKTR